MKRKMFNKLMALLMAGAMTLSSAPVTAQAVYAREVTEDSIIADENAEDAAAGEGDMIDLTEDKENVGETGLIDFSEEEETVGETGPTDLIQTEAAVGEKGEDGLTEIAASEEEALVEEMLGDGIDGSYYALVNIPYAEFYAAEGDDDVDAVSSSTKAKPRATNLAGGSYHVSETGEDITGITYPVKLSSEYLFDLAMMVNSGEITVITDEDSKSYTIRLRGQEVPVTLTGKEVLFESPTYSFYVLGAEPASYKELTVDESGAFAFDKATGEADTVEGLTGNVKLNARMPMSRSH